MALLPFCLRVAVIYTPLSSSQLELVENRNWAWFLSLNPLSNAYWLNQTKFNLWGAGERESEEDIHALLILSFQSKHTVTSPSLSPCLLEYNIIGDMYLMTLVQLPSSESKSSLAHRQASYFFSPRTWSVSPSQEEGIMNYFQVLWKGKTVFTQLHANKLMWWHCWDLIVLGQEIIVPCLHVSLQIGLRVIGKESRFGAIPSCTGGLL